MIRSCRKSSGGPQTYSAGLGSTSKPTSGAEVLYSTSTNNGNPATGAVKWQGRVVGEVVREGQELVFLRPVDPDKHFFRRFQGYALHCSIIDDLEARGVTQVRNVLQNGATETTSVDSYRHYGIEWYFRGNQLVLPKRYFSYTAPTTDNRSTNTPTPRQPAQMRLLEA